MKRPLFLTLFIPFLLTLVIVAVIASVGRLPTALIVLCALAAALAGLITRRITLRLDELRAALRRLSTGDFDARMTTGRHERLLGIAPLFNEAAEYIARLVAELRRQQAALDAILGSIHDALIVVNSEGRIVHANRSFSKLVATDDVNGLLYWELLRSPDLIDLVRKAGNECSQQNVEIAGRTYSVSATRIPQTSETVITFHDITDIVSTDKVKRELVLNAAHELRTPLTAVRGYVETMEPIVNEEGRRCLAIIRRHTDRLVRLVQDIATLAELEDPGLRLDIETMDLRPLTAELVQMFAVAASSKQLQLNLESTQEPLLVRADRFRIEQALMNLIDNAIRYTEKGTITVRLGRQGGFAVVEVVDTGPGIENRHLPRLFERFYVVDKSRSRQTGGTGLGLSIVKHIVLLHGGEVSVSSTPGAGTRFTVTLPISPGCHGAHAPPETNPDDSTDRN
ncbi:MAG: ATP-binding protein [candidate division WOR-3 bacterium]